VKWVFMATLAALPLQWFIIASTPLGVGRLHQLAILGYAAVFMFRYRLSALTPVQREFATFVVANVVMLVVWSVVQLYHSQLPVGPVKEMLYLGVFLTLGAFVFRVAEGRDAGGLALLRWSASIASASVLIALSYSMLRNGISPPRVFAQTIASGDPEILQKELFKSAFVGFGYDEATVRGNIRHEVFGAILCSMYISAWATLRKPFTLPSARWLYRLSMLGAIALLLTSLSRSIIIAAAIWPLISMLSSLRGARLHGRQIAQAVGFVTLLSLSAITGVAHVLWVRFTEDTSSYEARQGLYEQTFAQLPDRFLTGGFDTEGESSHNFVLDALLRGGIFVALPAAVVMAFVVFVWVRLMLRIHLEPVYMVPVAAAFVLPIVRFLTSGGGLINPVEWATLAFVAGVLASHRRGDGEPQRPEQLQPTLTKTVAG